MDHDRRFKSLIREFFAEFLQLFFAPWVSKFDLSDVEWLDKEVLSDPPEGSRHQLGLVARLHTRERVSATIPLGRLRRSLPFFGRATAKRIRIAPARH
jgi:hypothetical protein